MSEHIFRFGKVGKGADGIGAIAHVHGEVSLVAGNLRISIIDGAFHVFDMTSGAQIAEIGYGDGWNILGVHRFVDGILAFEDTGYGEYKIAHDKLEIVLAAEDLSYGRYLRITVRNKDGDAIAWLHARTE